jgi:formylglycine-generating enzyme required for sulfatase activity
MIDWVTISEGAFWMGSDGANVLDESPVRRVMVSRFQIARVPVTNAQYKAFVDATNHPTPGHWVNGEIVDGRSDHPVTYVDWYDANAFAIWCDVRLPTEAEWERAARGQRAGMYPWGNESADSTRAHYAQEVKKISTCSVYAHPLGASEYGVLDMAGNVWEWVSSAYCAYPYDANDGREDAASGAERVLRGGSFYIGSEKHIRCTTRSSSYPTRRRDHIGFRVARSI